MFPLIWALFHLFCHCSNKCAHNAHINQLQVTEPAQPQITMPSSFSSKPGYYDDSEQSTKTDKSAAPKANSQPAQLDNNKKSANDAKAAGFVDFSLFSTLCIWEFRTLSKSKRYIYGSCIRSGWLNRLNIFKAKNQAHLPDDKDPKVSKTIQNKLILYMMSTSNYFFTFIPHRLYGMRRKRDI